MLKALKKVAPDWYVPISEEGEENPTRFKIRPLTPPQRESVMESNGVEFVVSLGRYSEVLRMGLLDWENFVDADGQSIAHSVLDHARIPGPLRLELAVEILNRSRLQDEEIKN